MNVIEGSLAPPCRSEAPRAVALVSLAFALGACGEPAVVPVARDDGGASDSTSRGPRGRVSAVDGVLLTDRGSTLRGVSLEADLGVDFELYADPEAARPTLRSFFDRMTLELGLNAFELYLEGWDVEVGTRAEFADVVVEETARAGMYLVLGPGSGPVRDGRGGSGWFDPAVVEAFWTFYAGRYADEPHVVYQVQKVPDRTCDGLWAEPALTLERDTYSLIRSLAPESHVVLFSFAETPDAASFEANVAAVSDVVDFRDASVGFHAHDECAPLSEIDAYARESDAGLIPLLVMELPRTTWQANLLALEERSVGWFHYHWLEVDSNLSTFRAAHEQADASWCPDFGTWPMDAAECGEP